MHPNRAFRKTPVSTALDFARHRAFGTLAVNGEAGPLLAHVPFLLDEAGEALELHLVRSNPIVRNPGLAVLSVLGPDSYISPDWYDAKDQVPTWNYVAVHLRGPLELLSDAALEDLLERQSAHFEGQLYPKQPWLTDKMSEGTMEAMMRAIVPARMRVDDVQSTWKLNQNKPEDVRQRAAHFVARDGIGTDLDELSQLMEQPPK
ncbi:MAG: FMN-binding negative transcriptional regulator [Pseudomonadota bacterium]